MTKKIIERKEIKLNSRQMKMIKSGWGNECVENAVVESISYISGDLRIKGYLAYPKIIYRKYPCVIWCRGGFGEEGSIDEFNARGIFGQIAGWGYVVFTSQYRGSSGSRGKDEFGGEDINDILNLIPLADEIECADPTKWGIEGWSRGGMMTYLTLTRSDIFKCAIISGGITYLDCDSKESKFSKILYDSLLGNEKKLFTQKCKERSIINFPEEICKTTSLLILHGTADERVPVQQSLDLSYKLIEYDIPFRLLLLEGGDHFLKSHRNETTQIRKEWFDRFLLGNH